MKKLIDLIKVKERENNFSSSDKKANSNAKKTSSTSSPETIQNEANDLFWDGYSDIGYC